MPVARTIIPAILLFCLQAAAQQTTFQDSLLDHMSGKWVLDGTIENQKTVHDVTAEWVLGHQYMQIREISREKDAKGQPAYEAIVLIGWEKPSQQYVVLWLDSTSGAGLKGQALGYAQRNGDEIPILFKIGTTTFHTTFSYSPKSDTWQWRMDNEEKGKLEPFSRVKLTRK